MRQLYMKNEEIISRSDMRTILQTEYGIIYFPKRPFRIPAIDQIKLRSLVGDKSLDDAKGYITYLVHYVRGYAATDSFGSNHDKRRAWIHSMNRQYGKPFLQAYDMHNQFRGSQLGLTNLAVRQLATFVHDSQLRPRLSAIGQELVDAVIGTKTGKRYNDIDSVQEKLAIVHLYEDRSLEVIRMFTSPAQSG